MIEQYVHSLYWAYATCGTVAYGDIIPVTPVEKMYGFFVMILAKIFVAFIYAEAATVVANSHAAFTNYINKKALVKQWMQRIKLNHEIQARILAYYDLLW
jgi:hyperpolarization activated cyclic nucleotide-gated potassium channel 2